MITLPSWVVACGVGLLATLIYMQVYAYRLGRRDALRAFGEDHERQLRELRELRADLERFKVRYRAEVRR